MPAKKKTIVKRPKRMVKGSRATKRYMAFIRSLRGKTNHSKKSGGMIASEFLKRRPKPKLPGGIADPFEIQRLMSVGQKMNAKGGKLTPKQFFRFLINPIYGTVRYLDDRRQQQIQEAVQNAVNPQPDPVEMEEEEYDDENPPPLPPRNTVSSHDNYVW